MGGVEIERKFLVDAHRLPRLGPGQLLCQGYLPVSADSAVAVRVRLADGGGFLTLKQRRAGRQRAEFEYPIPADDARALLALCPARLEKTRHLVEADDGHRWEVDVFRGDNAPLVLAELELADPDEPFQRPPWLAGEVTDDGRYYNAHLAVHPYNSWQ